MWDALLDWDAKACGYLIAHEPYRGPVPASSAAAFEAREINAGVRARICVGPSSCRTPRPGSEPGVSLLFVVEGCPDAGGVRGVEVLVDGQGFA